MMPQGGLMNTLIVYSSRCGYTGECAEIIRDELGDDQFVMFTNIDSQDPPTVADYHRIIIGGSVRYGRVSRKLKRFMEDYRALLLQREVGLFLTCLGPPETSQKTFSRVFTRDLREQAKAHCFAGGVADPKAFRPLIRGYLEKRFPSFDTRDHQALRTFARQMKQVRKTPPAS